MNDLDELLNSLARLPIPPEVARLDGAMIMQIAISRRQQARRASMMAGLGALFLGVASTMTPANTAVAAPLLPLGTAMPFAPSSLLVG